MFAALDLGFEIEQFLAVDDREAPLFRLRRVDQHAFHVHSFAAPVQEAGCHVATNLVSGDSSMHEKRGEPKKESPWTACRSDCDQAGSVGACVAVRLARAPRQAAPDRRVGEGAAARGGRVPALLRAAQAKASPRVDTTARGERSMRGDGRIRDGIRGVTGRGRKWQACGLAAGSSVAFA
jgi:hypothetical protein